MDPLEHFNDQLEEDYEELTREWVSLGQTGKVIISPDGNTTWFFTNEEIDDPAARSDVLKILDFRIEQDGTPLQTEWRWI